MTSDLDKAALEAAVGLPYQGIARACLLIALDNGGINRSRSVDKWRRDYTRWIERQDGPWLESIDAWLLGLSTTDLDLACNGGSGEPDVEAVRSKAPPFTEDILDGYFDMVC